MSRNRWIHFAALALLVALASCARKTETATEMTSDSLLSSSPVEQPAGDITPTTDYQEPAPVAQTPAYTPPRRNPPRQTPSNPAPSRPSTPAEAPGVTLSAGTAIPISVSTQISSENASPGDSWTGTVTENVVAGDRVVIPAGSTVEGVVSGVQGAQKGSRAFVVLAVRSVNANGTSIPVSASTDSIIAGSTRARNLGAIAGSAAAGAIIGKTVGGSGKGALIGGLIGAAASGAAVAKSKGYQVVVKEGTNITFNVNHDVRVRS